MNGQMTPKSHTISSRQHPIVKYLVKLRQDRQFRHEQKTVLIEGKKLVQEVCQKVSAKKLIALDESLITKEMTAEEVYIVPIEVFEKISGLPAPEGLLAEVSMPANASLNNMKWIIACDGINDPGNLGTLIRTALALGWEGVFLLEGCCDPYNEKAIRAAKGATFRLPIATGSWAELKEIASENGLTPLVADAAGKDVKQLDSVQKILLILCNEANGPSAATKRLCKPVSINMPGEMESLNVAAAGAILMYQLRSCHE